MAANEIHVDDWGTEFIVTLYDGSSIVDISSATTKEIWFEKPNGTREIKPAIFVTNGEDGKLTVTIAVDFLDAEGDWRIQAYIVSSAGKWHSDIAKFEVYDNIPRQYA